MKKDRDKAQYNIITANLEIHEVVFITITLYYDS